MLYYSPSTGSAYAKDINPVIPADAVEVTPERWAELLAAQSEGAQIVPGDGGAPQAVFPPPPTAEQILQWARSVRKVSRFQARTALRRVGKFEAAEEIANNAGGEVLDAWHDINDFYRNSPTLAQLAPLLWPQNTDAELDNLFDIAEAIIA